LTNQLLKIVCNLIDFKQKEQISLSKIKEYT